VAHGALSLAMTIEATPAATRDRAPELDVLRFIAASMVVVFHYAYRPAIGGVVDTEVYGGLQNFAAYGYLGVQLFFMISGFVIVWSAAGRGPGKFVKLRFLRLYPMFWVGVAITALTVWLAGVRPEVHDLRVILANLTLVPAYFDAPLVDGVYWTLVIELKFYLLIFLAILLRQMPNLEKWLYLWLAGSIAFTFWTVPLTSSMVMLPHGFYFVGGAICYFIRTSGFTPVRALTLSLAVAGSAWHAAIMGRDNFSVDTRGAEPVLVAMLIVLFYVAMLSVAMRWVRLPQARFWATLGALTYPLYLLHNMLGRVILWELEPHVGPWGRLLIVSAVVYALAWVCARWIEPAVRDGIAALLDRLGNLRWRPAVSRRAGD
jgi:peptidoglycan/LPS O-acetylase OafA/YrhL